MNEYSLSTGSEMIKISNQGSEDEDNLLEKQKFSSLDSHRAYFLRFAEWHFGCRVRTEVIFLSRTRFDEPSEYDMCPEVVCLHHLV